MKLTELGLKQLIQLVKDNHSIYEIQYVAKYNQINIWKDDVQYTIHPRANATEICVDIFDMCCDSYYDGFCYDIWKLSDVLKFIRPYINNNIFINIYNFIFHIFDNNFSLYNKKLSQKKIMCILDRLLLLNIVRNFIYMYISDLFNYSFYK
jgi:hypothetical protein